MKARDLRRLLSLRPFLPLEMRTSDGQAYRIHEPVIAVSDTETVLLDGDDWRFIDNDNIVSLRRIRSGRSGNGKN